MIPAETGLFLRADGKSLLPQKKIVYNEGVMTKREQELLRAGWERRFVASEPRLAEAVELYESIGFEVLLDPLPSDEEMKGGGCE